MNSATFCRTVGMSSMCTPLVGQQLPLSYFVASRSRRPSWQTGGVPDIAFHLVAEVSSESPEAIESLLIDLVDGNVTPTKDGFHVEGWMRGPDARELNRFLLSALRRVERRTRLRTEWTGEGETHRFFDYVPKGTSPAEAS